MAENSGIEWTDHTFNPWQGCSKVSPACKNCYAMELVNRYGGDFLGRRVVAAESGWKKPLKWNRSVIAACNECGHDCLCEEMPKTVDPMKVPYDFGECSNCGAKQHKLRRQRVFCASLSDVFEDYEGPIVNHKGQRLAVWPNGSHIAVEYGKALPHVPHGPDIHWMTMVDVRRRLFELIDATPNLDWLLLTKRPENIEKMWPTWPKGFPSDGSGGHGSGSRYLKNVWIGTTVENQEQADKRIPELLKCRDLSPVLFLSCEPLLGPVDLRPALWLEDQYFRLRLDDKYFGLRAPFPTSINWVIVGGESGKDARPMNPAWVEDLRSQCGAARVPFFFKQWGEWQPERRARHSDLSCDARKQLIVRKDGQLTTGFLECGIDAFVMNRVGKKRAGRLLDGKEFSQFPSVKE